MELLFEKENLLKAIQVVQGVAAGRNTLPILSNVLIDATSDQIVIASTDLEVGIRMVVPGIPLTREGQLLFRLENLLKLPVNFHLQKLRLRQQQVIVLK